MSSKSVSVLDLAAMLETHLVPEMAKSVARSLFLRLGADAETLTDAGTILDCDVSGYLFTNCATCQKEIPAGKGVRRTFELADLTDISRVPGCGFPYDQRVFYSHVERAFCSHLCNDPDGGIEREEILRTEAEAQRHARRDARDGYCDESEYAVA